MKNNPIDLEKIWRDFHAVKPVGKGKHAHLEPDIRVQLRALEKYLRWKLGPPRQMTWAEIPAVVEAFRGPAPKPPL